MPAQTVFIGTYTGPKSEGIYRAQFEAATGKLSPPELAAKLANPTFLAVHPNGRFLYAAGEVSNFGSQHQGAMSALSIAPGTGLLTLRNQQPSGGSGPCHLALDHTSHWLLTANYGSGSVAVLPVRSDGTLGPPAATVQHHGSSVDPRRQEGPHAHFIITDPDNRLALACDLGLDQVLVYQLDPLKGSLAANDSPAASVVPGAGPRHLAFHPNGRLAFVINEMASTLTVFTYDPARGSLKDVQTVSTLPGTFRGPSTCAEVAVHPSGRFVYGSNRGHDSIAVFAFDAATQHLTPLQYVPTRGKNPRHFALDPSGHWLLAENQDTDNIVIFHLDDTTGRLTDTGEEVHVGSPVCLVFQPGAPR